jgi:hypothetical protein
MNKGLWGGLLLSLGWVSGLAAQEDPWRAAADSQPGATSGSPPGATVPKVELDRPVSVRPPPAAAPAAAPAARRAGAPPPSILPTGFAVPEKSAPPAPLPPMLAHPMPIPVVIAASATSASGTNPPTNVPEPSDEAADEPSEFATARTVPGLVPIATGAPTFNPWAPAEGNNSFTAEPVPVNLPPAPTTLLNPRFYLTGEYLLWWTKGENTPVLLSTSSPGDLGILGSPTTRVLFGGGAINAQARSGARFTAGWWLNDEHTLALEAGVFFLGTQTTNFSASSGQFPVLTRPFFNVNSGQPFSDMVTYPGVATGSAIIHAPSTLWGFDTNLRSQLFSGCNWEINGLAGFRYLYLGESLNFTENIQGELTAPAPFTNEKILVSDRFATFNQFYGGQVGLDGRWQLGRWTLGGFTKLGLGSTVQTLDISGLQHFVAPSGTASAYQGGLLALPGANIGRSAHSAFSFVPEVGVNVGYQITPHLRGFVGYNLLYWTNVLRPGDQIDTQLNVSKIPNFPTGSPASSVNLPAVPFRESSFWAQGVLGGLELTF